MAPAATSTTACPTCGEQTLSEANFCEACGADLLLVPCYDCGWTDIADGYCMNCGRKQPAERDHQEFDEGGVVAVTDRGKRHHHNEDSAAIGMLPGGGAVLVVCDGVSSTAGSAEASLASATAACELLVRWLGEGDPDEPNEAVTVRADQATLEELELQAMVDAAAVAQAAAADEPEQVDSGPAWQDGPPSCTYVAAVSRPLGSGGAQLTVGWIGDSRAYWVPAAEGDAIALTVDHEIEGGLIRWLGADNPDAVPSVTSHTATGPGWLLACSDGMWRYADDPAELAGLVRRLATEQPSTLALAAAMVEFALESGGHDNISVALWPWPPESEPERSGPHESDQEEGKPADE